MIIHNTKEGEYFENRDLMRKIQKTDEIRDLYERYLERVKYCTEDYKAWNYLKARISEKGIANQLHRTVSAIGFNPKSYESWYHRYYINKQLNKEDKDLLNIKEDKDLLNVKADKNLLNIKEDKNLLNIKEDKNLLNILIKADKRNLHCWNYISKLYSDFSFIPKDVTNYSYLHYTGASNSLSKGIFDPISCIFTDCYDQGMWFYYFAMKEKDLLKNLLYVRRYKNESVIIFREIFEGEIEINKEKCIVNIPTTYLNIDKHFTCIKINGKEYNLKKVDLVKKYYRDINLLEDNKCIYNMIFNYELWGDEEIESGVYNKYTKNAVNDKYEIYTVCE